VHFSLAGLKSKIIFQLFFQHYYMGGASGLRDPGPHIYIIMYELFGASNSKP